MKNILFLLPVALLLFTLNRAAASFSGSDLLLLSKLADQAHIKTEELGKADGKAGEAEV